MGWLWVNSDTRRRVSVNTFNGHGQDKIGSSFTDYEVSVTYRPISPLEITSGVRVNLAVRDAQWVEKVTDTRDHYVFGHLNQTTTALTERVNVLKQNRLGHRSAPRLGVGGGSHQRSRSRSRSRSPRPPVR